MELRLVILSVACFSCLIPSAVSINLLAAKAAAGQAATNIAAIGTQTLAAKKAAVAQAAADITSIATQAVALKGLAVKKAAASVAGAMINGAANIGASIAKAGLNMVAAKFGIKPSLVYQPSIVFQPPVLQEEFLVENPAVEYETIEVPVASAPISTVSVDVQQPFFDLPPPPPLSQVWTTVEEAAPSYEIVGPADSPYVYEIVASPQMFTGPLMETFQYGK